MTRMLTHVCILVLLTKGLYALSTGQCHVACQTIETMNTKLNLQMYQLGQVQRRVAALEGGSKDLEGGSNTKTNVCNVRDIRRADGKLPKDCTEIYTLGGRTSGIYHIQPYDAPRPFRVLCDITLDGGWTLIMRRFTGSVDFYRNWIDYKNGFGYLDGEFWLGNDKIHWLTSQNHYKLHLDMRYWANKKSYSASYEHFSVGDEAANYRLYIHGYLGNVGWDGLSILNGRPFSTKDRDNDASLLNCAQQYKGAFWHHACHRYSLPTGMYKASCKEHDCMEWKAGHALDRIMMKVKHD